MKVLYQRMVRGIMQAIHAIAHIKVSRRQSLFLSLCCHVFMVAAVAHMTWVKETGLPLHPTSDEIVFELVEQPHQYEKNSNNEEFTNQDNSSEARDLILSNASATHGTRDDVQGNSMPAREQLLMASLDALDDMRSPFNFKMQQVASDSVGAFSPVSGFAPDTRSLSEALNAGILKVNGFGRGNCPPRGGILK